MHVFGSVSQNILLGFLTKDLILPYLNQLGHVIPPLLTFWIVATLAKRILSYLSCMYETSIDDTPEIGA